MCLVNDANQLAAVRHTWVLAAVAADLCEKINREYPKLLASVGGQISIDIAPRSNNKSQIADILNKQYDHIHFYGDRMDYGGNDYPLATTITIGKMGTAYPVESYKETWEVLKQL